MISQRCGPLSSRASPRDPRSYTELRREDLPILVTVPATVMNRNRSALKGGNLAQWGGGCLPHRGQWGPAVQQIKKQSVLAGTRSEHHLPGLTSIICPTGHTVLCPPGLRRAEYTTKVGFPCSVLTWGLHHELNTVVGTSCPPPHRVPQVRVPQMLTLDPSRAGQRNPVSPCGRSEQTSFSSER